MAEIDWEALLQSEDVEGLWNALYRLVSRHPAARPLRFATDETAVSSEQEINADLAQELFLELFQKQRFDYYVANDYTSSEIENELTHIELPNLVGARLRRRYPESFRMARRVSALLKTSPTFRRFGPHELEFASSSAATSPLSLVNSNGAKMARGAGQGRAAKAPAARIDGANPDPQPMALKLAIAPVNSSLHGGSLPLDSSPQLSQASKEIEGMEPTEASYFVGEQWGDSDDETAPEAHKAPRESAPRRQRMVNQIYGLKTWSCSKPLADSGHFADLAKSVAVRKRDTRIVGRSGTSQLIISNKALEQLMVEVFNAIDSPADVRTVRQLALSKIPLQDYSVASLDGEFGRDDSRQSAQNGAGRTSGYATMAVDLRPSAEDELLRREHDDVVAGLARNFLSVLRRAVNDNQQRYGRLLQTLWHCYYDPKGPSQIETAQLLGVSDSLVSNNRKLIEHELRKLRLSMEDGPIFSESLRRLIVANGAYEPVPALAKRNHG
jgi:hypothetical protein